MMMDMDIWSTYQKKAFKVLSRASVNGLKFSCAESCTGGLLSAVLTSIPGGSHVFEGGVIAYSDTMKHEMLFIEKPLLEKYGAVSREIARDMAISILRQTGADLSIAVTGIAGPEGGSKEKPVGLVYFGLARQSKNTEIVKKVFLGNRQDVQLSAVGYALNLLLKFI